LQIFTLPPAVMNAAASCFKAELAPHASRMSKQP
jgi:hypothetical protein